MKTTESLVSTDNTHDKGIIIKKKKVREKSRRGSISNFFSFFFFVVGQNANDHDDGRLPTTLVVCRDPLSPLFLFKKKRRKKEE
jgi:hypothetical protein